MRKRWDERIARAVMRPLAVAALCLLVPLASASDAVTSFLERHGLNELIALHLEDQLDEASDSAAEVRQELILRLAGVYTTLLERERDDDRRAHLERRSRELLSRAPPNSADELRLALLRASYLRAEGIAERHRLRLADDQEVAQAKATFDNVIPELQRLNSHYDHAVGQINARLSRASGPDAAVLHENLDRLERMRGSCRFLLGWSLYYRAWLGRDRNTEGAERKFAEVLLSDVPRPQPEDVSIDLRAFEPMARAIVGMALCRSLSGNNSTTALRWIDLLDDEHTFPAVREQTPVWRLVIHLEHAEFREAQQLIESRLQAQEAVPVYWLRLAAVAAMESDRNVAHAGSVLRVAIAQLAAADELAEILELAERYGSDRLGTSGFAVRYVNGLIRYREARHVHDESDVNLATVRSRYQEAETELRAALNEPDASNHPAAAAACRRLLAWSLYFQSEYLNARQAFERAAAELPANEASEALWMAIVCLDRLVQADEAANERLLAEREELIDRFLEMYPASPRAAALLVSRASRQDALSDDEISRLLAIAAEDVAYYPARRRVSQALYQRFRTARPGSDARIAAGEAFLGMGAPMLDSARAFTTNDGANEDAAAQRQLIHIRRVLEVALHDGIADIAAAGRALAAVERLEATHPELITAHAEELKYRRLQERLYVGDVSAADDLAHALWENPESIWARLGARTMFQHSHARWKREGDGSAEVFRLVARHGGRVLREFEADAAALQQSNVLSYHAAVAEASFLLWKTHNETAEGPRALFLYQRILAVQPRQKAFLRPAALLAAAVEDHEFAAECWRTLGSGVQAGSDEWFEARLGLIEALAEIDPTRARDVMDQHKQLHPGYGPSPWAERLRALDLRLAQEEPT